MTKNQYRLECYKRHLSRQVRKRQEGWAKISKFLQPVPR